MSQGRGSQEWISRSEACELIGCSEQTLRRLVKNQGLETREGERGRTMLRVGDLVRLGRLDESRLAEFPNASAAATATRMSQETLGLREQVAELRSRLDERDTLTAELRADKKRLESQVATLLDQMRKVQATVDRLSANSEQLSLTLVHLTDRGRR